MFREFEEKAAPPTDFVDRSPSTRKRGKESWRHHLVAQDWHHFTAEEHGVWDTLFGRQVPYLGSRIVTPFLEGIPKLGLDQPGIPDLDRLNERLHRLTGWQCVSVPGLVPDEAFFAMLADRYFPIGNFIRGARSLDYLEEPDCFHDIFGHVPMLAHEPVARAARGPAPGAPARGAQRPPLLRRRAVLAPEPRGAHLRRPPAPARRR